MPAVESGGVRDDRLDAAPSDSFAHPAGRHRPEAGKDHLRGALARPSARLRAATPEELADWDGATVDSPGGHVFQSRAWAAHCATGGWRPRFIASDDGIRILALERRWPLLPGSSAYISRGPVAGGTGRQAAGGAGGGVGVEAAGQEPASFGSTEPASFGSTEPADLAGQEPADFAGQEPADLAGQEPADFAGRSAAALIAAADALAAWGADVVAADPEIPADEERFGETIRSAGFRPIEELQPSRHRLSLPLPLGSDDEAVFGAISKSTRQRIRAAERDLRVVRFDGRAGPQSSVDGMAEADEPLEPALARFATLLEATGERRGFRFDRADFIAWWRAAHAAGHLLLLEARDADEPVGGLLLYRHGGRLSTAHSADRAQDRRRYPGVLHLLRWRAAQLAIREGCTELDLGGVDVEGARRPPIEGEPMYGLYQHKLSFGARWLELTGAHERVARPARYAAGRVTSRLLRTLRPVRDAGAG